MIIKITKKQAQMLSNYFNSDMKDLGDLYSSYSTKKAQAQALIFEEMRKNQGYDYRVCGGNSMMFTCAYKYDTRENGNINKHLVYHTAYNRYDFIFEIIEGE